MPVLLSRHVKRMSVASFGSGGDNCDTFATPEARLGPFPVSARMSVAESALRQARAATHPAEAAWIALCLGLAALAAAAILVPPYPPLQDYPEWAYQGQLLARLFQGLPIGEVRLADKPIPNSSVQLLLGLLSVVLSPALAARLFLLALIGASVAMALALGRQFQPRAPWAFAALLLVVVFLNAAFWNGYANFQLGMLILGGWFLLDEARRGRAGVILLFSLALFFTHAMVFAAFGILLGITAVLEGRMRATVLGLLPAAGLTAWYVLAGIGGGGEEGRSLGSLVSFLAYKIYTFAKLGPYHNFVFAEGGDGALRPLLHWGGVAVNILFAAGLVLAMLLGLRDAIRAGRLARAPLAAAALLLAAFAVLPDLVQNVVNPGERLMLPALLMLLLILPLPPWLVRTLGLGGLVLAANILLLVTTRHGWEEPLHWTQLEGRPSELFRHRPTAFACKWEEMRRNAAAGDMPRQPLSFGTSILVVDVGRTFAGCTGRPG